MKASILVIPAALAAALSSCTPNSGNPYGAPAASINSGTPGSNPYAVPQANGETNAYPSQPGVGGSLPPVQQPTAYTPPANPTPDYTPAAAAPAPSGSMSSYTVKPGDSLWKISRKHSTSVGAIKAANGLSSDRINVGQTLQIPSN